MLGLFKKSKLNNEPQNIVAVSDLKQHIVNAYDQERELKLQVEELQNNLKVELEKIEKLHRDLGAMQIIADEKACSLSSTEEKLKQTNWKLEKIERNSSQERGILTEEVNTLKIKLKQYEDQVEMYSQSDLERLSNEANRVAFAGVEENIILHKGYLSKERVLSIVSECLGLAE